jgi:hypothetical protein
MDPTDTVLSQLSAARTWTFRNVTPYVIVVRDDERVLMRWEPSPNPTTLCPSMERRDDILSDELHMDVYYASQPSGFSGLTLNRWADNLIVMPEVGQYMKTISYSWKGHIISPDLQDGRAKFENGVWTVYRLLNWR